MSKTMPSAVAAAAAALALAAVSGAGASAPPVGALPPGPESTVVTQAGELVAVALPHRSGGRVWRIARALDAKILKQVSEADVGSNVVVVFKAVHAGSATIAFALTRGETAKAFESRSFKVQVR
jgi:hypothetical protein